MLAFVILSSFISFAAAACDLGFSECAGSCYAFFTSKDVANKPMYSWFEAREFCMKHFNRDDIFLATIRNMDQFNCIMGLFKQKVADNTKTFATWTGFKPTAEPSAFANQIVTHWESSVSTFQVLCRIRGPHFQQWHMNEPNGWKEKKEDCALLVLDVMGFLDYECTPSSEYFSDRLFTLCEINKAPSPRMVYE